MTSFVQALGGVDLHARSFSTLRKFFVNISCMLVSGTSRRRTQLERHDVTLFLNPETFTISTSSL